MARQHVSLSNALEQAHILHTKGQTEVAFAIYSQILEQFPNLDSARKGLNDVYKSLSLRMSESKINSAINSIKQTAHFANAASIGWTYTAMVDHKFISDRFKQKTNLGSKKSLSPPQRSLDKGLPPAQYFQQLNEISGLKSQFDFLLQLTQERTDSILGDSYINKAEIPFEKQLVSTFPREAFNILILGAGPAGLALANMLKCTLKEKVNILVIEKRTQAPHIKHPYKRNWLTNIPEIILKELIDPRLWSIFSKFSKRGLIGLPIHILETLMLLSCKDLGVQFLFHDSKTYDFLTNLDFNVVFDATGNRLKTSDQDSHKLQKTTTPINADKDFVAGYQPFGVDLKGCRPIDEIALEPKNDCLVPHHHGKRIKSSMIKITNLPINLFSRIQHFVKNNNHDNRFYFWTGALKEEINRGLMIINLTPEEHDILSDTIKSTLKVSEIIPELRVKNNLDTRLTDFLTIITDDPDNLFSPFIEPPFIYDPYFKPYPDKWERFLEAPLIPIGDSIYNGHVKCGNGITNHLCHLRSIHDTLIKNLAI